MNWMETVHLEMAAVPQGLFEQFSLLTESSLPENPYSSSSPLRKSIHMPSVTLCQYVCAAIACSSVTQMSWRGSEYRSSLKIEKTQFRSATSGVRCFLGIMRSYMVPPTIAEETGESTVLVRLFKTLQG